MNDIVFMNSSMLEGLLAAQELILNSRAELCSAADSRYANGEVKLGKEIHDIAIRLTKPLDLLDEEISVLCGAEQVVKHCKVNHCSNTNTGGMFVGDFCMPCYEYITTGNGRHSQMYFNSKEQTIVELQRKLSTKIADLMLE